MTEKADRLAVMVRLPRDLVREVDHLSVDEDLYRGEMMALLMREALDARKAAGRANGGRA